MVIALPRSSDRFPGPGPHRRSRALALLLLPLVALLAAGCAQTRTVILVRHAQAFLNLDGEQKAGLDGDRLDSLTDAGRADADRIGAGLASRSPDLILASPKGRTMQTGARIALGTAAAFEEEPLLLPRRGEESSESLVARVVEAVDRAEGGTIVLVTHGDVLGAFLGWLRSPPGAADSYPPQLEHGGQLVLTYERGRFQPAASVAARNP